MKSFRKISETKDPNISIHLWEYQAERQRAEIERQEKLKLAAKLRELGMDTNLL